MNGECGIWEPLYYFFATFLQVWNYIWIKSRQTFLRLKLQLELITCFSLLSHTDFTPSFHIHITFNSNYLLFLIHLELLWVFKNSQLSCKILISCGFHITTLSYVYSTVLIFPGTFTDYSSSGCPPSRLHFLLSIRPPLSRHSIHSHSFLPSSSIQPWLSSKLQNHIINSLVKSFLQMYPILPNKTYLLSPFKSSSVVLISTPKIHNHSV